jgi:hypothetical protein
MPNYKISELPVASTLTGDELIAVVQGGITKQSLVYNVVSFIKPYSLTVQDGVNVDLSDLVNENIEMLKLSWTGASGTMVLSLPFASANENRVFRIISNGGFVTSTRVELTPQSGETLDGSSSAYTINNPYEGIQCWSDGTEWFIIQKKP